MRGLLPTVRRAIEWAGKALVWAIAVGVALLAFQPYVFFWVLGLFGYE